MTKQTVISNLGQYLGQEVALSGWLNRGRASGKGVGRQGQAGDEHRLNRSSVSFHRTLLRVPSGQLLRARVCA